ncbi:MAG: dCMP deaminase family protein [Alphaproteobacteria bacterium]|nr:dCMP deaminase family protein [Alphaproteobacteria bacterium]
MIDKKWDKRFLEVATLVASWSKDRSTQVGAVVVGSKKEIRAMGYNGFPRGVNDDIDERHERPVKYDFTEHAERNAIYNACYTGVSLDNCTIYVTHVPCSDCARAIIQSGIKRVVVKGDNQLRASWQTSSEIAAAMFKETNVELDAV